MSSEIILKIIITITTFLEAIYFAHAYDKERKGSDIVLALITITISFACLLSLLRGG